MKTKGIGMPAALLGIVALLLGAAVFAGVGPFSTTSDRGATGEVKDATLNLKASQLGSSSGISTTAYATLEDGTVVTKSLSADQFTAWTNTFNNQMSDITVQAFDSSNYPIARTFSFEGSTTENLNIKTAQVASASDVSLEARETSGSSDNDDTVNIAAGGQATLNSIRASVDVQDKYWNAGYIYVDTPDNSNVTVTMPNNEQVAVPDSAPSSVDKAFEAYSPSEGEDSFTEFAEKDSNRVVMNGDDSNDPSETVTFYVDDKQAYQDSDTGDIAYGVEDSSDTNLGLAEQSLSVTVN